MISRYLYYTLNQSSSNIQSEVIKNRTKKVRSKWSLFWCLPVLQVWLLQIRLMKIIKFWTVWQTLALQYPVLENLRELKKWVLKVVLLNQCSGQPWFSLNFLKDIFWYSYHKDTEPLYHSFMYSLVSLLSCIYPFLEMHSLLVTIICYEIYTEHTPWILSKIF